MAQNRAWKVRGHTRTHASTLTSSHPWRFRKWFSALFTDRARCGGGGSEVGSEVRRRSRAMSTCAVASRACTPASVREEPVVRAICAAGSAGPPDLAGGAPRKRASAASTHPWTVRAFAWRWKPWKFLPSYATRRRYRATTGAADEAPGAIAPGEGGGESRDEERAGGPPSDAARRDLGPERPGSDSARRFDPERSAVMRRRTPRTSRERHCGRRADEGEYWRRRRDHTDRVVVSCLQYLRARRKVVSCAYACLADSHHPFAWRPSRPPAPPVVRPSGEEVGPLARVT